MEMISIIASMAGLIIAGLNAGIFIVIKFNDLRHLEDKVDKIVETTEKIDCKVDSHAERIAKIEGRLKGRKK